MAKKLTIKDFEADYQHIVVQTTFCKETRRVKAEELIASYYMHIEKECQAFLDSKLHVVWVLGFTDDDIKVRVAKALESHPGVIAAFDPNCEFRRLSLTGKDLSEDKVVDLVRKSIPDGKFIHFLINKAK